MTDHLINVQQELVNTQQLVDAKKNETSTEEHLQVGLRVVEACLARALGCCCATC